MKCSGLKACAVMLGFVVGSAANAQITQINLSPYVNTSYSIGAPVGSTTGTPGIPGTSASITALAFNLLNPGSGNNVWVGSTGGQSINISTDVVDPSTVYTLFNTLYGQNALPAVSVEFVGSGGATETFTLVGNTDIRDYNNWEWTDTINGTTTQEWWTNNTNPVPFDQSHRLDAQIFTLSPAFGTQTLTNIIVTTAPNAGTNYFEPMLTAIDVAAVPEPSTYALMLAGLGLVALAARRRGVKSGGRRALPGLA
jgi:PEP-CTERM motif-containing protein